MNKKIEDLHSLRIDLKDEINTYEKWIERVEEELKEVEAKLESLGEEL